jgi:hypothetical protein
LRIIKVESKETDMKAIGHLEHRIGRLEAAAPAAPTPELDFRSLTLTEVERFVHLWRQNDADPSPLTRAEKCELNKLCIAVGAEQAAIVDGEKA